MKYEIGSSNWIYVESIAHCAPTARLGLIGSIERKYIHLRFLEKVDYKKYIADCWERSINTNGWKDNPWSHYYRVEMV